MAEIPDPARRRAAAYWLALAFHMKGESRAARNALVLTAHRTCGLDLLDLVRLAPDALPEKLRPFAVTFERFLAEEGRVSAQAFVVDRLAEAGIEVLPITDARYPAHLAQRLKPARAPTVLLVAGNVGLLRDTGIAVSGSRDAGPAGLAFARAAGQAIARSGISLVTGLARGVDREALYGVLDTPGTAIGVAAEGILNLRMCRNPEVTDGRLVIVSEFDPTQRWTPGLAMARNSTIAGLSRALVVADCVAPGGTLDQIETHRHLEMPVFVRRGRGEGRLVAEVARRPGVQSLPWEVGPVHIPGLAVGVEPWATCELRRGADALEIRVRAAPTASLEDVIDTIRAEWGTPVTDPAPATPAAETAGRVMERADGPASGWVVPGADLLPATVEQDPVLHWFTTHPSSPVALAELSTETKLAESRLRQRLRSLEEAGEIVGLKQGRRKVFQLAPVRGGPDAQPQLPEVSKRRAAAKIASPTLFSAEA